MCGAPQEDRVQLQYHLDQHMNFSAPCIYCDKSYLSEDLLKTHYKIEHLRKAKEKKIYRKNMILAKIEKDPTEPHTGEYRWNFSVDNIDELWLLSQIVETKLLKSSEVCRKFNEIVAIETRNCLRCKSTLWAVGGLNFIFGERMKFDILLVYLLRTFWSLDAICLFTVLWKIHLGQKWT